MPEDVEERNRRRRALHAERMKDPVYAEQRRLRSERYREKNRLRTNAAAARYYTRKKQDPAWDAARQAARREEYQRFKADPEKVAQHREGDRRWRLNMTQEDVDHRNAVAAAWRARRREDPEWLARQRAYALASYHRHKNDLDFRADQDEASGVIARRAAVLAETLELLDALDDLRSDPVVEEWDPYARA